MGFFDRLFGDEEQQQRTTPPSAPRNQDDIAIERYRYLLRTAPPDKIEEVHAEAFAKLTPEQRQRVYDELKQNAGETPAGDDPQSLAQAATRAELRQPGTLERSFQGPSFGSILGASLLGTVAGYVVGSAIMSAFMAPYYADASNGDQGGDQSGDQSGADASDGGADASADGGGDFGGDFGGGDFGGDFGGF
jgi:hypothetical protein